MYIGRKNEHAGDVANGGGAVTSNGVFKSFAKVSPTTIRCDIAWIDIEFPVTLLQGRRYGS